MKHFVVSDFHLNMGRVQDALHPLEDFDSDDEFEEFLATVQSQNGHLIINGDWVDFLQLEPFAELGDHESAEGFPLYYTGSTAMEKLENCLRRQSRHFAQLRGFLANGGRVTVLPGNHDADWFFPGPPENPFPLQRRLREELGKPPEGQLQFVEDYFRVGTVHIEHGHQRCEHVNKFETHPTIFHAHRADQSREPRIELLWGSRLVVEFFNGLEQQYPFADNLKPMTRALWLGIKNRWVSGRIAADFLRFMLGAGTPWSDVAEVLDPGAEDPERLVKSLPDDDLRMLFLERLARDAEFQMEMEAELAKAPQKEKDAWGPHPERADVGREVVAAEHDAPALGLIRDKREIREAKALLDRNTVTAVVFGHTHEAVDGKAPDAPAPGYFNTGTWTRSLDLKNEEVKRRLRDADFPLELLKDPTIFQYRLTYLEITETPAGELLELKQVD